MNVIAVVVSDYIGFLLLVAMLVSSQVRRAQRKFEIQIFSVITIMTMVACVVDVISFWSDGKSGTLFRILNIAANTYCFMVNPIFVSAWCLYEDYKLYKSRVRVRRIYAYAFIPAVLMVLVAFYNLFVPVIFYIDNANVYHRLPFSYVYYIVDAGYLIFSVIILKNYEKKYGKVYFFPLILMIGPIVLGCALQMLFYGVSLIWVSLSVGLTAIYMSLQNEFSYLDTLTGLYNRAYLDYEMETALKGKDGGKLGAIMIDVDYFKRINDTFGHSIGDEALIDVARVITLSKPDKAVAIRFAGDEFIIIVKNTSEMKVKSIIDNIREELRIFNENEGRQYKLSLSLGYAIFDSDKDTFDSFFKRMDDNMYLEKSEKHGR